MTGKQYRRKCASKKLIQQLKEGSNKKGVDMLRLDVYLQNDEARNMYKKLSFEDVYKNIQSLK